MSKPSYCSALAPYFERFVALKRACGLAYDTQAKLLGRFDCYLQAQWTGEHSLSNAVIRDYVASLTHLAPRSRDNRVSVAWLALSYALRHGGPVESLPRRPAYTDPQTRVREPYVFSVEEVMLILTACGELTPSASLRPHTCATLFGLLYATGIRVGEALALDVGDLDVEDRLLLVREGKFGKDRLLPIRPSTAEALSRYLNSPKRRTSTDASDPLFITLRGTRPAYSTAHRSYRQALELTGIRDEVGRFPRIHDLRYAFAAHRIAAWYRAGRDVNELLGPLSTYLGHVGVSQTLTYLRPTVLLLEEPAARFETACVPTSMRGLP